jgi:hypothetical protein
MKIIGVVALIFAVSILVVAAGQEPVKIQVPVLPTERDQFGGRPGSFHFVTNEQTMADAAELQNAFSALDRIDKRLASADKSTLESIAPELKTVRSFVSRVNARRNQTAGDTAKEVEERLNASKGKFMCGACHGHGMGMMHRGGMRPGGSD